MNYMDMIENEKEALFAGAYICAVKDSIFLDNIYDAILLGEDVVITEQLHPNGMLPLPQGRVCVTEVEVLARNGMFIQKLKPEFVEIIKCYPKQIKVNIWLPVTKNYNFGLYKNQFLELLKSYQTTCEKGDIAVAEKIAAKLLIYLKRAKLIDEMEEEYGREPYI